MTNARILHGDVMGFARHYHGPKAHALLCDPPYHLTTPRFAKTGGADRKPGAPPFARTSKGFMGKKWDGGEIAFQPETWAALAEHLYPGAFGMAFASSRGWHRLAVAIEDAGLIIHPTIFGWVSGQGFPKASRIDTQIPGERVPTGEKRVRNVKPFDDSKGWNANDTQGDFEYTTSVNPLAKDWEGHRYGLQALKPALEPIIVFQVPYDGRPIDNITETGAGALNIDGARIGFSDNGDGEWDSTPASGYEGKPKAGGSIYGQFEGRGVAPDQVRYQSNGRWPANFFIQHTPDCKIVGQHAEPGYAINRFTDGAKPFGGGAGHEYASAQMPATRALIYECVADCPVRLLGEQSGPTGGAAQASGPTARKMGTKGIWNGAKGDGKDAPFHNDEGTAARFFHNADWAYEVAERLDQADPVKYQSKASRAEREAGLSGAAEVVQKYGLKASTDNRPGRAQLVRTSNPSKNSHPTVKPIALIKWLATLLLPPDRYQPRRLLVPFAGVGSEMIGAGLAGWDEIIGIEGEQEYVDIGRQRLAHWLAPKSQTGFLEA